MSPSKAVSLIAGDRKIVILRGQFWATHSSVAVGLVNNLDAIERGLTLIGRQFTTDVGRIDILAKDAAGTRVVIEIKVGEAKDSAIGQIARYLGWFARTEGNAPRGILIAGEFPEGVRYAATAIPALTLLLYKVHFSFERATV